ncbi:hypothetical protein PHLGIDRAFT_225657 [Phlebiopsis gigantea 11061_1 CR5-6]|uniref:Uncharacterized protein n=1 Tax=Phlebiopsis gigantea (strain 11061_1 CR5-6) TaxID=745531 RepID=A0A0C3S2D3_PHLG1|nr:hypothetical protein PHLGIDRAFT_225657 [Phlebiopsis gigantea 11061_1 CR5-6]
MWVWRSMVVRMPRSSPSVHEPYTLVICVCYVTIIAFLREETYSGHNIPCSIRHTLSGGEADEIPAREPVELRCPVALLPHGSMVGRDLLNFTYWVGSVTLYHVRRMRDIDTIRYHNVHRGVTFSPVSVAHLRSSQYSSHSQGSFPWISLCSTPYRGT